MMNPIIQSLFDRKSCRIFKDKEISQEDKNFFFFCNIPRRQNTDTSSGYASP